MWNKMSLGVKVGLGFGIVVAIAIALGMMAVFNMKGVQQTADILVRENVPEVAVANNVERWSLKTMFEMRGFVYTEDENFLINVRQNLAQVKKYLADAKAHGESSPRLFKLKDAAEKAEALVAQYEDLVNTTASLTIELKATRDSAKMNWQAYIQAVKDYISSQDVSLEEELAETPIDKTKIEKRLNKIYSAFELRSLGNQIFIGTWEAQIDRDPALFRETEKKFKGIYPKLNEILSMTVQQKNKVLLDKMRSVANAYEKDMQDFLSQWEQREELNKKRNALADQVLELAKSTAELGMSDTTRGSQNAGGALETATRIMISGLIVGVILAILLAFLITTGITGAIIKLVRSLDEGSQETSSAAQQVAASSQQLSQGATEQASSLEQTSSALDEMTSMIRQNADNAVKASQMATEAKHQAEKGDLSMKEMQSSMKAIGESADKVGSIIKTIEEIAFQTNILALNAAVEAARAGEHGKGFAVVADEVRHLAQRASLAAKDTLVLIENSQTRTKEGAEVTQRSIESLGKIIDASKKVADTVNEIALASKEQAEGINQVTNAISQMDQVTQQNAASAEQSAAASEELSSQADSLKEMIVSLQRIVSGEGALKTGYSGLNKGAKAALRSFGKKSLKMTGPAQGPQMLKPESVTGKGPRVLKPEEIIPFDDKEGFKDF